nr:MAG TPA: hypothetical protein [Caudoviricetes sp.]
MSFKVLDLFFKCVSEVKLKIKSKSRMSKTRENPSVC